MTDLELIELAAKAAGIPRNRWDYKKLRELGHMVTQSMMWNPIANDGERYRLIRNLEINIDFSDKCAWKRMPNDTLIMEFWGADFGDEAHAVLNVAAQIGSSL